MKSFNQCDNCETRFAALERSKKMADTLNAAAAIFLSNNDETFEDMMSNGMLLIARAAELDRLSVWRNTKKVDGLHASQIYRWDKAAGGTTSPTPGLTDVSYEGFAPRWEALLAEGESVNSPVELLPEAEMLRSFGVVSVFVTPIFVKGVFWGFVLFENRTSRRYFDDDCAEMLHSAAFLCANSVMNEDMKKLNELQLAKIKTVIHATKIGLWDMEFTANDPINNANAITWSDDFRRILGFTDEQDFPNIISSFHNCLHPDDYERVTAEVIAHMMDSTGQTPYKTEYRAIKKDGELAYIRATGETIRDKHGNPIHVAGSIMDITEQKRQNAELDRQNRAKTDFLATMSHEIRTPMNAIIGIAQIEMQKAHLPEEYVTALEKIYSSGNNLLGIINDILDISKVESGNLELNPVDYVVPSLINDTIQLNEVRIGSKPIKFVLELSENLPSRLFGDELRLKQILNNLLSNAVKYTDFGLVKLSISHAPHGESGDEIELCFAVEDTGQGLKPADKERLFTEYLRFNNELNRSTEGTGLGLKITKKLTELMGGTITVESEYGRGSVFTVTIVQKVTQHEPIGAEIAKKLKTFSFRAVNASPKISHQIMPYGSVLIVDDFDTNLYVAKELLAPYKLKIETADSGFEAIRKVKSGSVYDIIFMDCMMPKMDGTETTQKLLELGYAKPIVALTANALVGQSEISMQNGFSGFVSKPIDIVQMDEVLHRFIVDVYPEEAARYSIAKTETPMTANQKLYPIIRRDIERGLTAFREAIARGDSKAFITTAHAMKSALAYVGEHQAAHKAAILEEVGFSGDIDTFIELLETLYAKYNS